MWAPFGPGPNPCPAQQPPLSSCESPTLSGGYWSEYRCRRLGYKPVCTPKKAGPICTEPRTRCRGFSRPVGLSSTAASSAPDSDCTAAEPGPQRAGPRPASFASSRAAPSLKKSTKTARTGARATGPTTTRERWAFYSVRFSPWSLFSFHTENEAFSSLRVPVQLAGSLPPNEPGIKATVPGENRQQSVKPTLGPPSHRPTPNFNYQKTKITNKKQK